MQAVQSLKYWAACDCLLCGGPASGAICAECDAALPRIARACPVCALPRAEQAACGPCLQRRPLLDGATCAFEYRYPLEALVRRFKYGGDLACGKWLARALERRVAGERAPDLIVVPPLAASRLHQRGFNQAIEIAAVIARARGIRLERSLVHRTRQDAPQAGLPRRARLANLRGAFACRGTLAGEDVVVVDDVLTTGATGHAMAVALKEAGARTVRLWAVARTPAPGD